MPRIGQVAGVVIAMHYGEREHPPPHIHAIYGEHDALVSIGGAVVLSGYLPRTKERKVADWVVSHRAELWAAWERAWRNEPPGTIRGSA